MPGTVHSAMEQGEPLKLPSATLESLIDSASQVADAFDDVMSRASRLDSTYDVTLDVIADSSRLAAVVDALCARRPHHACFLWSAVRNLVRDVIGHVTSIDLQPLATVTEDRGGGCRAAAELDLFYADRTHLGCMITL